MTIVQDNLELLRGDAALAYWQQHLRGAQPSANANLVSSSPSEALAEAGVQTLALASELQQALRALAESQSLKLDVLLAAAWSLLLSKYSGEDDVLVGHSLAAEVLPLRTRINGEQSLGDWLTAIAAQLEQHQLHADIAPDALHHCAGIDAGQPLFESLVGVQHATSQPAPVQIMLHSEDVLSLELRYHSNELNAADAENILHRVQQLFASFVQGVERPVSAQTLLDSQELERVIYHWNATELDVVLDRSLYALFEEQVVARHQATALVAGDVRLSYQQLAERAGQIAAGLRSVGVTQGDRIALSMDKTPDLIAAMLGIIKLGAAYVPIGLDAPAERRAFIISDAQVRWTLTARADEAHFADDESSTLLFVDDYHTNAVEPLDDIPSSTIAYIIYTSAQRPPGSYTPAIGLPGSRAIDQSPANRSPLRQPHKPLNGFRHHPERGR